MPATTWTEQLRKRAREWHEMKKEKAEKARKKGSFAQTTAQGAKANQRQEV